MTKTEGKQIELLSEEIKKLDDINKNLIQYVNYLSEHIDKCIGRVNDLPTKLVETYSSKEKCLIFKEFNDSKKQTTLDFEK